MTELQLLRKLLNERLTAAAIEIFGAIEKTVFEYQEENERLRRMLRISPEKQLYKTEYCDQDRNPGHRDVVVLRGSDLDHSAMRRPDSLQFSVSEEEVPPEQQHCEQEWSPSLGQEDLEPTQIKEEQEELRTSQEEEQLQGHLETKDFVLTPPCVNSECDQENPLWSLTLPQSQTEENRESDPKPVGHIPFFTVTDPSNLYIPCVSSDSQHNASRHISTLNQLLTFNTGEKPFSCADCGKGFNQKGGLSRHILTHTGEKPFSCGDCGKCFVLKQHLNIHKLTHTGKKSFICGVCGKSFYQKGDLSRHIVTHTGEKLFSCGDCGKRFSLKKNLIIHKRTHTGEKQFCCDKCGKRFNQKGYLTDHKLTHTGEKPYGCLVCGNKFTRKPALLKHMRTIHKDRELNQQGKDLDNLQGEIRKIC